MIKRQDFLFAILLILAGILVYFNSLTGDFIYDDRIYVTKNTQVVDESPILSECTPANRYYLGLYRPLFTLTLRANYLMAGLKPSVFHGTNAAIHIFCILSLFLLIRSLTKDRAGAFVGALLFAVHPVHVEAVTWITGRAELLSCFFCLLTALTHFNSTENRKLKLLEGVFFVLAVLSKENAMAFPLVIWLLEITDNRISKKSWIKETLIRYWFYLPLLAGLIYIRIAVMGRFGPDIETAPFKDVDLPNRIEAAFSSLAEYLRLNVFPHPLKIFYHITELQNLTWMRGAILAAFALLIVFAFKKKKSIAGWLLWIPASLLTVLNIIPIGAVFAERFAYLPSAGACAAAGLVITSLIRKEHSKRSTHLTVWIPTVFILCFSVLTIARNPVLKDDLSLWKDAVEKGGEFAYTHYNLGEFYALENKWEYQSPQSPGAFIELKKSLQIRADHPYAYSAHYRLGEYYLSVKYKSLITRYSKTAPPGISNDLKEFLRQAAFHLDASIKIGPRHMESNLWKPLLLYARIPLYWGGLEAVPLEKAMNCLEMAEKLGAPPQDLKPIKSELEDMRKLKIKKN